MKKKLSVFFGWIINKNFNLQFPISKITLRSMAALSSICNGFNFNSDVSDPVVRVVLNTPVSDLQSD